MPDKFNEADIHNALALGVTKDKAKQLREYTMDGNDIFIGGRFGPDGKYKSDYDLYRDTADTKEYREEFLQRDLEQIKKDQVRKNNKTGKFYDGHGIEKPNANINAKVRANMQKAYKRAGLNDELEINRIMYAKDWNDYKDKADKRKKKIEQPFETALDNVQQPQVIPTPSTQPDFKKENMQDILKNSSEIITQKLREINEIKLMDKPEPVFTQRKPKGLEAIGYKLNGLTPLPHYTQVRKQTAEPDDDKGKGLANILGVD